MIAFAAINCQIPSVFNIIGRLLTYVFIFTVAGGHWGMMQVIAWSEMTDNQENNSFLEAVFSNPCELCFTIKEGNKKEKQDRKSADNAKNSLIAGSHSEPALIYSPRVIALLDCHPADLVGIRSAPAKGPPRGC